MCETTAHPRSSIYSRGVHPDELTPEQRAWLEDDERLWRRAHAIVEHQPHLDVSDVYHALVNLRREPGERLARGLAHARLRPH